MQQTYAPAALVRGGTSKGVFFTESDLPRRDRWDSLLLDMFGSPDPMQLDGIGGSHSTTSKAIIVSDTEDDNVDVVYHFGQVGVDKPVVDWGGNCGNLTFAVGVFAADRGFVTFPEGGRYTITLLNDNTDTVVEQTIEVDDDGDPIYLGDFTVDGVPGDGTRIRSRFIQPTGSETASLFPTGERRETLTTPEYGTFEVSIVDVSNPVVFVRENDLDVPATATPAIIDADEETTTRLETIRSVACERLGFVDDAADATCESPGVPKIAFVGEPRTYETVAGDTIASTEFDVLARIMSMQKAHHAYAVTGAMCTATASLIPGTIPYEYAGGSLSNPVVLGHPKGTMRLDVELDEESTHVEAVSIDRTARKIMDGKLFYSHGISTD